MDVRIGITTSLQEEEQRLQLAYVRAVEQAGGLPLIVPMLETDAATQAFAGLLDGLIITGGPAIIEGLIGEVPADLPLTDPVRARSDVRILKAFLAARKPVLGICYGMQLLNAQAGGTLYADVQRQVKGSLVHSSDRGGQVHRIAIKPATLLRDLLGTSSLEVNTRHVQAIAEPGSGLRVAATAPDGVIEAIENEDGTLLGVQFHPERMGTTMQPLFRHLVERACTAASNAPCRNNKLRQSRLQQI